MPIKINPEPKPMSTPAGTSLTINPIPKPISTPAGRKNPEAE